MNTLLRKIILPLPLLLLLLPSAAVSWVLRGAMVVVLLLSIRNTASVRKDFSRSLAPLAAWFCYYLLAIGAAAFPNLRISDVQPQTIQYLSHLAIDNIIAYDFSRVLVEDISPLAYEVVPGWQFTDRGPLAGVLTALCFRILGLEEHSHWLGVSPGLYYLYQALLTYLNTSALFLVFLLSERYWGRWSAAATMLILGSSYFFFINSLFTWPKFYGAALLMLGVAVASEAIRKQSDAGRNLVGFLGGALLAAALLSHETASFALAAFFLALTLLAIPFVRIALFGGIELSLRTCCSIPLGWFLTYLPWILVKYSIGASENKLLYTHLLCSPDPDLKTAGFLTAVGGYLTQNGLSEILLTRWQNISYPLDFTHAGGTYRLLLDSPFQFLWSTSHLAFYQMIHSVGLPLLPLVLCALFTSRVKLREAGLLLLTGAGSLLVTGLLFACPLSTVNHTWGYVFFLVLCMLAAAGARQTFWTEVLFAFGVAWNVCMFVICWYFGQARFAALHVSGAYVIAQLLLFLGFLAILLFQLRESYDEV